MVTFLKKERCIKLFYLKPLNVKDLSLTNSLSQICLKNQ